DRSARRIHAPARPTPAKERRAMKSLDANDRGAALDPEILRRVRRALERVEPAIARARLEPATSLVDDLGLDSIRFVDLAFALEDALDLEEFPMQAWADAEANRAGRRFT